ncbi:unnamed protein product [Plutella xylostella]|uniref:(diamondback moth) hypothetical protein n=1 Tax=Plutella xylostella TaxID=51655 RepID=A0A8S4FTD3_PLUXY|nr:unnamed protein product [Plutella xylostella]
MRRQLGEDDSSTSCCGRASSGWSMMRDDGLGVENSRMGCPEGGPDALEPASDDDDDEEQEQTDDGSSDVDDDDKPLDPRAGRVNVVLPSLPVPAAALAELMRGLLRKTGTSAHMRVKLCMKRFEQLAASVYPLKVPELQQLPSAPELRTAPARVAARQLRNMEKQMMSDADDLALRGLGRKHRKRLLARRRAGLSIADDLAAIRAAAASGTDSAWQVEEAAPAPKKTKTEDNYIEFLNRKNDKKRKQNEESNPSSPPKKQKVDEKAKVKDKTSKLKITVKDKAEKKKEISKDSPKRAEKVKIIITDNPKNNKLEKKVAKVNGDVKIKEKPTQKDVTKKPAAAEKQVAVDKKLDSKKGPFVVVNKLKNFQKQISPKSEKNLDKRAKLSAKSPDKNTSYSTPKKVKFVLKNNSMQETIDYYKSVRQSPNIPYDGSKKPSKTNLKPNSTPSPINPFFKKKLRLKC